MILRSLIFIGLMVLLNTTSLVAQNEVIREQHSLYGLQEFGVVVNVEKPVSLEHLDLRPDSLRSLLLEKISQLPVVILDDDELRKSDQLPILYLHINVMEATSGMHPFTATMHFYQPVKLSLNNDVQTTASTWHDSIMGLVPGTMIDFIAAQSSNLAVNFRLAYQTVN